MVNPDTNVRSKVKLMRNELITYYFRALAFIRIKAFVWGLHTRVENFLILSCCDFPPALNSNYILASSPLAKIKSAR